MPDYLYTCDECGRTFGRLRAMKYRNRPLACPECEGMIRRDTDAERAELGMGIGVPSNWPQVSPQAGVHPNQVAEARRRFPHHRFNKSGDMIFRSAAHRRQCLKDIGMRDWNSYYD